MGESRTMVWNQIKPLRELGYKISAHPRRGYHLVARPDKLYPWEVVNGLSTQLIGRTIEYYDELPSPKLRAKELLPAVDEGAVILAEMQTAGRGRLGAVGFARHRYLAQHHPAPAFFPIELPKLNLLAVVALSRAVKAVLDIRPLVKWPNDLYYQDRKLAGILTEVTGELGRLEHVIMGVGINVNQRSNDFPLELRTKAGSLRMATGCFVDRKDLLRKYLQCFEEEYFYALEQGFGRCLDYCRQYTATLGRPVEVDDGRKVYRGEAVAIADDGALIIAHDGQRIPVMAGDVQPLLDR